ncbi:MAG: hypothetical protein ACE5PM_09665 [Candidatus Hydrothermarchaeales archaeon]
MKIVQTRINDLEYALLRQIALEKKSTIKDTVKEAIALYVKRESVDPNDVLFSEPVARRGARDGSLKHDRYIYG